MNALLPRPAAVATARAVPPSERWTPSLRTYVNVALDGFVGDDNPAGKFRTPRECAEYYHRVRNSPLLEFVDMLDELDEAAAIHGLVDERNGETSINGAAMERGESLERIADAVRTGELATVRTVSINGREFPRVRGQR